MKTCPKCEGVLQYQGEVISLRFWHDVWHCPNCDKNYREDVPDDRLWEYLFGGEDPDGEEQDLLP